MSEQQTHTLGLALAGGGARGFAHVGVLKVLEKHGIRVDYLCGSSMGGLVAALYAAGFSPAEIEKTVLSLRSRRQLLRLIDLSLPTHHPLRGMFAGQKVRSFFAELLGDIKTFSDLRFPLAVTAVDLVTAREVILNEGSLLDALMATTAVPGVFNPVEKNGMELVDGGVLNNLPVDLARGQGADRVIAVDVAVKIFDPSTWQKTKLPGIAYEVERMADIRTHMLVSQKLAAFPPDLLIHPSIPPTYNMFLSFRDPEPIIEAGIKATEDAIPVIMEWFAGTDKQISGDE
ncbi:MAG: patatin-like phospholipase family protein [Anaerolineales bacterium]|nr:patatin-like phospholipase family protein [Anaerolineales bacterium]